MTEKTLPLSNVHHLAIPVANIEDSINWYTSSFSCEVFFSSQTKAVLQFANIKLTLVLPSQECHHIALERNDAETLGELREHDEGIKSTFIADPSGNPIEIVQISSSPGTGS